MNINTMALVNQLLGTNAIVRVKDDDNDVDNVDTAATTINGVTITDYSNGAAVVNVYTAGGAFAGSETTGFSANARRRYKVRSVLCTYPLGYGIKKYPKTAKNCAKSPSARAKKLKTAQKLADSGIKTGCRPLNLSASSYEMRSVKNLNIKSKTSDATFNIDLLKAMSI